MSATSQTYRHSWIADEESSPDGVGWIRWALAGSKGKALRLDVFCVRAGEVDVCPRRVAREYGPQFHPTLPAQAFGYLVRVVWQSRLTGDRSPEELAIIEADRAESREDYDRLALQVHGWIAEGWT